MNPNPYSVGELQTAGDFQSLGAKFDQQLRVMQIIAFALMMGVMSFFGVVLVVTQGNVFGMQQPGLITIIAAGFAFIMIVNHFVIPSIIANAQLKRLAGVGTSDAEKEQRVASLANVYQVHLIVGLALLEGAAFFNLIALMIGKSAASIAVIVVLLSLMLFKFPTRTKVTWWIQEKLTESNT